MGLSNGSDGFRAWRTKFTPRLHELFPCSVEKWTAQLMLNYSFQFAGSPNFGHRSARRDLEAQMTIVTKSDALRDSLHAEQRNLFDSSERVTRDTYDAKERSVPKWVRLVVAVARNFF